MNSSSSKLLIKYMGIVVSICRYYIIAAAAARTSGFLFSGNYGYFFLLFLLYDTLGNIYVCQGSRKRVGLVKEKAWTVYQPYK